MVALDSVVERPIMQPPRPRRRWAHLFVPRQPLIAIIQFGGVPLFAWSLWQGFDPAWGLAFLAGYFVYGCLGVTIGMHRYFTHAAFTCPKWFEAFLAFCATISGAGSPAGWVPVHHKHHQLADEEGDPHNSRTEGWRLLFVAFYYTSPSAFAMRGTLANPILRFCHKYYLLVLGSWVTALFAIGGVDFVLWMWVYPACFKLWISGLTVWITHEDGQAVNHPLFALITWGEGFHKVHHDQPWAHRLSRWDIGGAVIDGLARIGLVHLPAEARSA